MGFRTLSRKCLNGTKRGSRDLYNMLWVFKIHGSLSELIKGKTCCVVGSSPDVDIKLIEQSEIIISVNRSAANIARITGRGPDISILDYELIADPVCTVSKRNRNGAITEQLLGDIDLGYLILVQSNNTEIILDDVRLRRHKTDCIRRASIRQILSEITGNSLIDMNMATAPSRGAVSIGLCAWGGAKKVNFTGFSIFRHTDGNKTGDFFYSDLGVDVRKDGLKDNCTLSRPKDNVRHHSLADSLLIASLTAQGFTLCTTTVDFFPVLFNWGHVKTDRNETEMSQE